MKFHNYVKHSLLHYPTLYNNRLDVMYHVFAVIGNGLEWEDGELTGDGGWGDYVVPTDELVESGFFKMKYDDLDEEEARYKKEAEEHPCLAELKTSYLIHTEYERIRRSLVEKHIEHMCRHTNAAMISMFAELNGNRYYIKTPCEQYARVFTVPEGVKEDWGNAALEFAKTWRQCFMSEWHGFGTYNKEKEPEKWMERYLNGWPEKMKKDYKFVARLQPVIDDICTKLGIQTDSESSPKWAQEMKEALELP